VALLTGLLNPVVADNSKPARSVDASELAVLRLLALQSPRRTQSDTVRSQTVRALLDLAGCVLGLARQTAWTQSATHGKTATLLHSAPRRLRRRIQGPAGLVCPANIFDGVQYRGDIDCRPSAAQPTLARTALLPSDSWVICRLTCRLLYAPVCGAAVRLRAQLKPIRQPSMAIRSRPQRKRFDSPSHVRQCGLLALRKRPGSPLA